MNRRHGLSLLAIAAIGIGLWMAFVKTPEPVLSDAYFDHEFITRVVDGRDPYDHMPGLGGGVTHPRPPGAIPAMLPLALGDRDTARDINNTLAVISVVGIGWYSRGAIGILVATLVLLQPGLYQSANQQWWIGAIILAGIAVRSRTGGVLMGVAVAIKLWPLAIVAAWLIGRDKRALPALLTSIALTAAGVALPNVGLVRSITAMKATSDLFVFHTGNDSLFALLIRWGAGYPAAYIMVALVAVWWFRHRTVEAAIVAALLVTPVVWEGYFLPLAPFVAMRIEKRRWLAVASLISWYFGYGVVAALLLVIEIELREVPARPDEQPILGFAHRELATSSTEPESATGPTKRISQLFTFW